MKSDPNEHVRDYLANERTYLAYLRTSLSLISLGISVNRFSLYLLEKNLVAPTPGTGAMLRSTENIGTGMAIIGLLVLAWGAISFTSRYYQIGAGTYKPAFASLWVLTVIILVAALLGVGWLFVRAS